MTSENDNQNKWDKVLLGEKYPTEGDPIEQKAYRTRQIALWESSNITNDVTPQEAQRIYVHASYLNRKRKLFRYAKYSLIGLAILSHLLFQFFNLEITTKNSNEISPDIKSNLKPPARGTSTVGVTGSPGQQAQDKGMEAIINGTPYMVKLSGGSFQMGCVAGWDDSLGGCRKNEKPPHTVKIKPFAISKYETTVGQFKKFVDDTNYRTTAEDAGCTIKNSEGIWLVSKEHNWRKPGFEQVNQHPVVCLSWEDTQAYIGWLSKFTKKGYRLPTEAEWEFAARGGKASAFSWGEEPNRGFANYEAVDGADKWHYTSPVGGLQGNAYELYDMSGNAWEWVQDCWRENYSIGECKDQNIRTRRGGGWDNFPLNIRSSYRSKENKKSRSYLYGFRVAHDIE